MSHGRGGIEAKALKAAACQRGVSLIIVLWVMALLMVIVSEFAFTMRVDTEASRNFGDGVSARYLAASAVNRALAEIAGPYKFVCLDGDGRVAFAVKEEGTVKILEAAREFELGDGKAAYEISDERAKLNVNTASRDKLEDIMRLNNVEEAQRDIIADSILDWIDPNHEHHLNGAEDDYYGGLAPPYGAKDGPLDFIEELLLVKGVTPEIFYGTGDEPEYGGLARYLTVRGDGRINLNTAGQKVLEAALGPGKAQEVLLRRETQGLFETPAYGGAVSSEAFSISARGEVRGIAVRIRAIAQRKEGSSKIIISYWNEQGISPD